MKKPRFLRKKTKLKFSKNGKPLCRYCELPVNPPRRTFCGADCVHKYRLLRSGSYVRYCLIKRDKGVCRKCGLDCIALKKQANKIRMSEGKQAYKDFCKTQEMPWKRKSWFDAHHIVAVAEGGGLMDDLSGYATLCCRCHNEETKLLQRRLKQKRVAKKSKKAIPLPASSINRV